ncbi:hypothetical protein HDV04_003152 [Boothiomyces sp. JEL0838]|nr:hypothetical protein HDV04_003152 [Boothiomyces sp. JEL0838]
MVFKNKFGAVVPEMLQVKDCFDTNDCIQCIALPLDKVKRKMSEDVAPKKRPNLTQIIPDSQVRLSPRKQLESPISDSNVLLLDKIKSNEKQNSLVDQIFESDKDSSSNTSKISGYQSDEDISETDQTKTSDIQIINEIDKVSDEEKSEQTSVRVVDLNAQENETNDSQENAESVLQDNSDHGLDSASLPFDVQERQELNEEVNFLIKQVNLAPTPRSKSQTEEPEKKKGRRAKKKELLKSLEINSQKNEEASQMSEVLGNGVVSPVLTSNPKASPKKSKKKKETVPSPAKPKPLKLFGDEIADIFELGSQPQTNEEFKIKSINMEDTPTQEGLTQSSPTDPKLGGLFSQNDNILDQSLPPSKQPSSLKQVLDADSVPENPLFDSQSLPVSEKSKPAPSQSLPLKEKSKPAPPKSQKLSSLPVMKKSKLEIVNPFSSIKPGQKFRSLSQITLDSQSNKQSRIALATTQESSSGESGDESDSSSDSDTEKSTIKLAGKKKPKRRKSMLLELAKEVKPGSKNRRSLPANAKINK